MFTVYLLADAGHCGEAVRKGLTLCAVTVIPSLFPFMIMTKYLLDCGFFDWMSSKIGRVAGRIFRVSPNAAPALICGVIAGFPLGAKTAADLYTCGLCSQDECERLMGFCNNCGPAFVIGCVGAALCGDVRIGITLYAAQLCSAITVGLALRIGAKKPEISASGIHVYARGGSLVNAVGSSVTPMLTVCAFVVFFSVVGAAVEDLCALAGIGGLPMTVISGIIEITEGTMRIPHGNTVRSLILNGAFIGWSGISVHMQSAAFAVPAGLKMRRYFLGKVLCGILCPVFSVLIWKIFC